MKYYLQMFTNFLDFRGRSSIKEFWMATLFNIIFSFLIEMLALPFVLTPNAFYTVSSSLASLYGIITFIPSLSLTVRRLHDTGHSGWFIIISIIPVIGTIALIYVLCQPSIYKTEVYHKDFYQHSDELYKNTYVDVNAENIDVKCEKEDEVVSPNIYNKTETIVSDNKDTSSDNKTENLSKEVEKTDVNRNSPAISSQEEVSENSQQKAARKRTTKSSTQASLVKKTRVEQIKECQQLLQDGVITKEEYDSRVLKILSR